MKFLVIDDNALDRHLLTSLLQELGHEVDICVSTEGAIQQIDGGGYTSVFLDIVMPAQDGYKVLRQIRSNPAIAQQHVIFCSSKRTPLEVDYGLRRAGANAYLPKPVSRESLAEVLQQV